MASKTKKMKLDMPASSSSQLSKTDFFLKLKEDRTTASESVMEFKFNKKRVRVLSEAAEVPERAEDNWAMLYAQKLALKNEVPLHVSFCLVPKFMDATIRHYQFMLKGLQEVAEECKDLNIQFHLLLGQAVNILPKFVMQHKMGAVVTDFAPLRVPTKWVKDVQAALPKDVPFCQQAESILEVDRSVKAVTWATPGTKAGLEVLHSFCTSRLKLFASKRNDPNANALSNLSPWFHFGGYNYLRKGLNTVVQVLEKGMYPLLSRIAALVAEAVRNSFQSASAIRTNSQFPGSTRTALRRLKDEKLFARIAANKELLKDEHKLFRLAFSEENTNRNWNRLIFSDDVTFSSTNGGKVIVYRPRGAGYDERYVAKQIRRESVDAFCEEAIVRRELADNFCFYNEKYDSLDGAYDWAKITLEAHRKDKRQYLYTREELEKAVTHDDLWNSAQLQLVQEGKMHGFLRMYWAKKILEWTESPKKALADAIYLNDRFSIDGRDPNGFVGCMWSICGIHDQGWAERPIFGKIRYMNYEGCKRKFDIAAYIIKWGGKKHKK
ncbi:hypothetical protein C0J52_11866 [Blattella germanica]|nr:hypothetical protein C0J52_11866 [Blattella germanica]